MDTRSRTLLLVLVCTVAVSAGCLTLGENGAEPFDSAQVDISGTTVPLSDVDLPPGATQTGLTPTTLAESHVAALRRAGSASGIQNETIITTDGRRAVDRIGYRFDESQLYTDTETQFIQSWAERGQSEALVQHSPPNGTRYFKTHSRFNLTDVTAAGEVSTVIRAFEWTATTAVESNGDTYVRYDAQRVADYTLIPGARHEVVKSFNGTLWIHESGYVAGISITAQLHAGENEPVHHTNYDLRFYDVGAVDATEPRWVSTARAEATEFAVTQHEENTVIQMEMLAGNPIPDETTVTVFAQTDQGTDKPITGSLDAPVRPGTTLYLVAVDETLQITREPPTATSGTSLESFHVGFYDPDSYLAYYWYYSTI